jgi:hypothetical protein
MKKRMLSGLPPLLLALLLGLAGCFKQTDPPDPPIPPTNTYPTTPPTDLPPATQTGAGTLGCKINGRVWTFWIPPIALTPEQDAFVSESDGNGTANIRARIWSADTFSGPYRVYHDLSFSFSNPNFEPSVITESVISGFRNPDQFRFYLSTKDYKWYYPDTSSSAQSKKIIIDRVDRDSNIISGRFDMVLFRFIDNTYFDKSDSLIITDGRFDFRYSQQ